MHQIRVQAAARGLTIMGDAKYGAEMRFDGDRPHGAPEPQRIALHALRLEFRHPQTAVLQSATASVPDYWGELPAEILEAVEKMTCKSRNETGTDWTMNSPF